MKHINARYLFAFITIFISGCSADILTVRKLPQEAPSKALYLYSAACDCIGQRVEQFLAEENKRVLLLTDRIIDGTKFPGVAVQSPLSYAGHNVIQHLTNEHIDQKYVVQPLSLLPHISEYFRVGSPVSRKFYIALLSQHSSDAIMAFDAEFTSNDKVSGNIGTGTTAKYRSGNAAVSTKKGSKSDAGQIGLVLKVGDPIMNEITHTVSLQAPYTRNNRTRSFTIGYKSVGAGLSRVNVSVDGLHNAQENIIAAAWFDAWAAMIPGDAELSCLRSANPSPSEITKWMREWEDWSKKQRITALQIEMNIFALSNSIKEVAIDGKLGPGTWDLIREIELRLRISSHSEGMLDLLYIALLKSRNENQSVNETIFAKSQS